MERVLKKQSAASGKAPDYIRAEYAEGTSLRTWVTADDIADTADEHGYLLVDIIRVDIPPPQER